MTDEGAETLARALIAIALTAAAVAMICTGHAEQLALVFLAALLLLL